MSTQTCVSKLRMLLPNVHLGPHVQTVFVVLEPLGRKFCTFPSVTSTIWMMGKEEGEKEEEEKEREKEREEEEEEGEEKEVEKRGEEEKKKKEEEEEDKKAEE